MTTENIGHYRLIRKLGEGGMGEVHLALDTRLHRNVALKFLSSKLAQDQEITRRFREEAVAASALNHPNVCVIHEVGETEEHQPFIAMEWLEGETLDGPLSRNESFEIDSIIDVAAQVADALDAAHQKKIIHRDIKPGNIHRDPSGRVKVLDFGLAKRLAPEQLDDSTLPRQTQPGVIMGTPTYMSPEQALGREVDHRSDLFSLGVVLYQLVAGALPFEGGNFTETVNKIVHAQPPALARFNYDVPGELDRITRKCLEKDPRRRYQSAREVVIDLRNLARTLENASLFGNADASLETAAFRAPSSVSQQEPEPEELAQSDIVISYAPVDDQPLTAEKLGWISQFHRNLEVRVEQLSGEQVRVWRHPSASDPDTLEKRYLEHLPRAKTMISVVSPPYVKSEGCCRQVEAFWMSRQAQMTKAGGSQIFKVVKRPVPQDEIPERLSDVFSQLLDFEFFEVDSQTGRVREFDDAFGQTAVQRYHERVYDLAQAITETLAQLKKPDISAQSEAGGGQGKTVYLATTTSDLQPQRDSIRRELLARGHTVVPDRPLPLVLDDLVAAVVEDLQNCDLSIHPIGGMYGVVPEGGEQSILEVQNQLAASHSAAVGLQRVVWLPKELKVGDNRQRNWIDQIRRDPDAHCGAEIVEHTLEGLKGVLVDLLAPRETPAELAEEADSGPPRIYLICDKRDAEAIEPIEDYLFDQGLEVSLPDFEAEEAEASEIHRQNLTDCDAAVIFYGAARHSWVDIKLRGLLKAAGYGRTRELLARVVYVAPPIDRRKERFRTHIGDVLRQDGPFDPQLLEPLVRRLKETAKNV